jgi:saccharopine dehydrogenase-like NADP-dependent oxidoreductase
VKRTFGFSLLNNPMRTLLVLGAGRSTQSLIDYLLAHASDEDWMLTLADQNLEWATQKLQGHPRGHAVKLDANDREKRRELIKGKFIVVSMLPAFMHPEIAEDCVELGVHLATASYTSEAMRALGPKAAEKGLILLNEIGVDPGIDHLSAMKLLDEVRSQGAELLGFESFTGGLLAPESPSNPWQYKFTWNPRNVVLAGAGGAVKFKQEGTYKFIPYHQVFRRTEFIDIPGYGRFEGYANRDSLQYRSVYGLDTIPTIYRGTLRRPGFCRAWDVFVKLGMTDDSYLMEGVSDMTHRTFVNAFLAYHPFNSVEIKLMHYLNIPQDDDLMERLTWLDLFKDEPIGIEKGTPAQVLEHILSKKWTMGPLDTDMLVMWHKVVYQLHGKTHELTSSLVVKGQGPEKTAMAHTVGLPLAMAVRRILKDQATQKGSVIPIQPEWYNPLLEELREYGIVFHDVTRVLPE